MGVEIERKFLVDHTKWEQLERPEGMVIKQGYMLKEPEKTIRIRIKDEQGYITIKGKSAGLARSEFEYAVPVKDANEMLSEFCEAVVSKVRYNITFAGKLWEVDVFDGDNEGLVVAEIELDDEHETFDKPDWVASDVSDDERYFNSNLSVHPYNSW